MYRKVTPLAAGIFLATLCSLDAVGQDYQTLARQPTAYSGRIVSFRGKIIQSLQTGVDYVLRVNVTRGEYNSWQDTVYVEYRANSPSEMRIIEGDIIDFRGRFDGIKSYTTVLGATVQIPHVIACQIRNAASPIRTVPRGDC
jgi:hypothetical protein